MGVRICQHGCSKENGPCFKHRPEAAPVPEPLRLTPAEASMFGDLRLDVQVWHQIDLAVGRILAARDAATAREAAERAWDEGAKAGLDTPRWLGYTLTNPYRAASLGDGSQR